MKENGRPAYSTWIRKKRILYFWLLSASILLVGLAAGLVYLPLAAIALIALPFIYIASIISLAAYRFGDHGGGFQNKIHETVIASLNANGNVLDIGCGSGNLIIKIAKRNSGSHLGLDFWGHDWEYSKSQCERNAQLEHVGNLRFLKGSASALPFASDSIQNVVSCLTFHEVEDVADKTRSIAEALRVLEPNGRFAFFDLFADPSFYPAQQAVRASVEAAHGEIELMREYSKIEPLPFPLDSPKVLKYAVLIAGRKSEPQPG